MLKPLKPYQQSPENSTSEVLSEVNTIPYIYIIYIYIYCYNDNIGTNVYNFGGKMDEFLVFDRALSKEEMGCLGNIC